MAQDAVAPRIPFRNHSVRLGFLLRMFVVAMSTN